MPRTKEAFDEMRETTRIKIEETAVHLFAHKGLAIKVGDIAKAAGISQGLMYSHYPSKNALIIELIRQATEVSSTNFMDWVDSNTTVEGKIKKTSEMMCSMFTDVTIGIDYFMFMLQVAVCGFEVPQEVYYSEKMPNPIEGLAGVLAKGQAQGCVVDGDVFQLAIAYWAMVQGMCCYAITGIPTAPQPITLNRIVLKESYL